MNINIDNFLNAPNESLGFNPTFNEKGNFTALNVCWGESDVATIIKGEEIFKPKIEIIKDDSVVNSDQLVKISEKIQDWFTDNYINKIDLTEKAKSI